MIERIRRNELQRLIPYAIAAISALAPIDLPPLLSPQFTQ
jgi:hypothetical protein